MNLGEVILGLAGIALGYRSLSTGVGRLHNGLNEGGVSGRYPTVVVPRSATRSMPPVTRKGVKMPTKAGQMSIQLREVRTLGDRLAVIISQANEGKADPRIVAWARREISKKCRPGWNGEQWCIPEKDQRKEADAIFRATRRDVRYLSDIAGLDSFSRPGKTLDLGGEDCDGLSTLLASALMSIGRQVRFKVIETKQSRGGPDHIYLEALLNDKWVPFDASVAMGPGWEAPPSMVRRAWIFETD